MIRTAALLVLVPLLAACNAGGERGVMWTDASEWDVRDGSAGQPVEDSQHYPFSSGGGGTGTGPARRGASVAEYF